MTNHMDMTTISQVQKFFTIKEPQLMGNVTISNMTFFDNSNIILLLSMSFRTLKSWSLHNTPGLPIFFVSSYPVSRLDV